MSKHEKRLERLCKKPPPSDMRWEEFVSIIEALGFTLYENGGGSSHKYFVGTFDGTERRIDTARPHPSGIMKLYQLRYVVTSLAEWGLL
ncbi:type II toxin-antitoxin system HicA family toxin [Cupriavidus sp. KB_39]|uniref:type II toxin-antitoxin system HicA family toxin n=1 Tax=Cupriavidus sp. KB_39 TaxID=3233036 RepID=UPI003F93B871